MLKLLLLPIENDGLFLCPSIGNVHVRDSQSVSGRAVGIEEDVHLEQSAGRHVQIVANHFAILTHVDTEDGLGSTALHYRYVVLSLI